MRVAVDVMGSDHGPAVITRGALAALDKHPGLHLLLAGDASAIKAAAAGADPSRYTIVESQSVIGMDEHPVEAIKKKQDSSLVKAIGLVAQKKADAIISAGSTGAQVAASTFMLGLLPGVRRAGIAAIMPSKDGRVVLLDVGANVACKPLHLVQYGVMGAIYATSLLGIQNPRVGLVSVGSEPAKGNALVVETNPMMADSGINFVGNCEGHDTFLGKVDVAVCDGFTGNVMLKMAEGMADVIMQALASNMGKSKGATDDGIRAALKEMKQRMDWQEAGGAQLLGVGGVSFICHGRSSETAITNAVRACVRLVEAGITERITQAFAGVAQAAE